MPEKIKVAIIVPRIVQLGPILMIKELVNFLSKMNTLNINVFYIDKYIDPLVRMTVQVERLDPKKFPFDKFDIVHTNGIRPDLFAFRHRKKIKYHISTIHNFVFDDLKFTYSKFISLIFGNVWLKLWGRADKLVCISDEMKNYYRKWFPEPRLDMIYYGITEAESNLMPDRDIIQTIEGFHSQGMKVIGTACIVTKRKGLDQLLYLIAREKKLSLLILGDGKEMETLLLLAKKLKISDRCIFCGFRSNASVYFRFFDFIILPSVSEGFCRVLVEAAQQQVPVICSNISVFKELFDEKEVHFFKLNSIDSLAEAVRSVNESPENRTEAAYSKYKNRYTVGHMAYHYMNLYQSA